MTNKTIEEIDEKYWNDKPKKQETGKGIVISLTKKEFDELVTEAHQAGIDDAVEKIKNFQRWADTDGGEAGMRAEDYGGWLDRDEVLQALQDNK